MLLKMKILFLLLAYIFMACNKDEIKVQDIPKVNTIFDSSICYKIKINMSEVEVINLLGSPNFEGSFILSDTIYEFQYNLKNLFPNFKDSIINIKQCVWLKNKKTYIWFRKNRNKWFVVDCLEMQEDIIY